MKNEHFDGIILEHICSDVFSCDRGGMGGIINSDAFEHEPLLASYLVIARLYKGSEIQDKYIGNFIDKWKTVFEYPDENEEYTFKEYTDGLRELIRHFIKFCVKANPNRQRVACRASKIGDFLLIAILPQAERYARRRRECRFSLREKY